MPAAPAGAATASGTANDGVVVTGPALYLAQTDEPFDSSGRLADEAARSALRQILQALAQIMRTRA